MIGFCLGKTHFLTKGAQQPLLEDPGIQLEPEHLGVPQRTLIWKPLTVPPPTDQIWRPSKFGLVSSACSVGDGLAYLGWCVLAST